MTLKSIDQLPVPEVKWYQADYEVFLKSDMQYAEVIWPRGATETIPQVTAYFYGKRHKNPHVRFRKINDRLYLEKIPQEGELTSA